MIPVWTEEEFRKYEELEVNKPRDANTYKIQKYKIQDK
jgi:hypothetical protein